MQIGRLCKHGVVTVTCGMLVRDAARLMRERNVGDLVVVERRNETEVPIGLLTDRDIVVGILARDASQLATLEVGDVFVEGLVTARDDEDLTTVLESMRSNAIRRVPIVDARGALVGIFTLDDLLALFSEDMASVAAIVARQREVESQRRL